MSVSTGDVTVRGRALDYLLRMPLSEASTASKQSLLLGSIQFSSGGQQGQLRQQSCLVQGESVVCGAEYEFPEPIGELAIDCTLYRVAAPTHVHILRARKGDRSEEVALDYAFAHATVAFAPVTPFLLAGRQFAAGLVRAATEPVQWLLLFSVVVAARTRQELMLMGTAFLGMQTAGLFLLPFSHLPVNFIEASIAGALCYLAIEILLIPQGRARWIPIAALGFLHSAFFAGPGSPWAVAGEALIPAVLLPVACLKRDRFPRVVERCAAAALMLVGMVWFTLRIW